jgi:hypothetical protein
MNTQEALLFRNAKGLVVGHFINKIYRKRVDSKKHRLRVMNAYGIDSGIVEELKTLECQEIRILETDTQQVLSIPFNQFVALAVERNFEGSQKFLPVHYFKYEPHDKSKI